MNTANARPCSRRQMIKAGAAAVMTLVLPLDRLVAETTKEIEEYGGLRIGAQSYTLRSMSFDNMLKAMEHDLKLHRVELFGAHLFPNAPPPLIAVAKKNLDDAGVQAVSFGVTGFTKNHEANRSMFEFARTMGMRNISCDPDPDSFDSLDKLVEEYQITAAIHDHGPGHRYGKIEQVRAAIKDHSPLIGLCNDTGHFIRAGEDPLEACKVFQDRMHAMHLKDFKKVGNGKFEDCILGDGGLNVEAVVAHLLETGYSGPLFIEYEGGEPVQSTLKSLERVRDAVKKARAPGT